MWLVDRNKIKRSVFMKKAVIIAILLLLIIPAMNCFGPGEPDETVDVKCPVDCRCLTEVEAQELGYTPCNGVKTQCSTDSAGTPMYCFGPGEPDETVDVQCPADCRCLTEVEAQEFGYTPCDGQKTQCGTDSAGNKMYCFEPQQEVTCPSDCRCLTEAEAIEYGYNLCNGQEVRCGTDANGSPKYCFEPVQTQAACPTGCECMTEAEGKRLGYNLCNGQEVQCGTNALGVAMYCFQKPAEKIEKITVSPTQASNPVGLLHTITIVVYGADGNPIPNVTIKVVHSGAQSIGPLYFVTGADGSYDYTYKSQYFGTEKVTVSADGISADAYTDWYIQKTTTFR
jgi:hypothetical protein